MNCTIGLLGRGGSPGSFQPSQLVSTHTLPRTSAVPVALGPGSAWAGGGQQRAGGEGEQGEQRAH